MAKKEGAPETTGDDARTERLVDDKVREDQAKQIVDLELRLGEALVEMDRLKEVVEGAEKRLAPEIEQLRSERASLLRENGELRGALRKATKDMVPDLDGKACVLKESVTIETTTKQRVPAQPGDICVAAPDAKLKRARQELGPSRKLLSVTEELLQELLARGLAQPA